MTRFCSISIAREGIEGYGEEKIIKIVDFCYTYRNCKK